MEPPATRPPAAGSISGRLTHYGGGPVWGDSIDYNGQQMGCPGSGLYSSADLTIVAVGPSRYGDWPCGTGLSICGPAGCLTAIRQDACPGCGPFLLDGSESLFRAVCGAGASGSCEVSITAAP